MLHPKPLFDGFFQEFIFSHGHGANLTNWFQNRKLKTCAEICRAKQLLASLSHTEHYAAATAVLEV
jgi:phosphopantetheinyl transferase (holo-ACP synthase)